MCNIHDRTVLFSNYGTFLFDHLFIPTKAGYFSSLMSQEKINIIDKMSFEITFSSLVSYLAGIKVFMTSNFRCTFFSIF